MDSIKISVLRDIRKIWKKFKDIKGHSAKDRSRSYGDVSDVLYNFLYKSKIFFIFRFENIKKKLPLSKIWKNLPKSYKIYQIFLTILEDGGFKTAPVKKKSKKKMECIL